jgi:hypothetical protein
MAALVRFALMAAVRRLLGWMKLIGRGGGNASRTGGAGFDLLGDLALVRAILPTACVAEEVDNRPLTTLSSID